MYTSNNQNFSKLLYNGPHRIRSTLPMGFSITVKNENLFSSVDNIPEKSISIERKQEQSQMNPRNH